jgi:hypothetical protein
MSHVFAAFRETRGPIAKTNGGGKAGEEEDENAEPAADADTGDPAIERSLSVFGQLFDLLLSDEGASRNAMIAFDLTQYVCERLRPEVARVKTWLDRLIRALVKTGVPPERRDDVSAALLLMLSNSQEPNGYRWARDCLIRMNIDFAGPVPSTKGVQGFQAILVQNAALEELWTKLFAVRTYPEQLRAYLSALKNNQPSLEYADLAKVAVEEWPVLENALTSEASRGRILALKQWQESCPRCQISLPTSEVFKLGSVRIATAKNCCNRVVVWTGE